MGCVLNLSYDTKTSELYNQPRNAAVQIAAAITAHARIHMHPYFSGVIAFTPTLTLLSLVRNCQMK
jgi:hypothetical protein